MTDVKRMLEMALYHMRLQPATSEADERRRLIDIDKINRKLNQLKEQGNG